MVSHGCQTGFSTVSVDVAEFDGTLANLKSNLGVWIQDALAAPDPAAGVSLLCQELALAVLRGDLTLPDRFRVVQPERYARRLIYDDPATGVSVLAMVWAPGQGTPLHDHFGQWGVAVVLAGEIETVPYELTGEQSGYYFFRALPVEHVTTGSTTYLIPPCEYHVTRNVSRQVAITLNIYGGQVPSCSVFLPTGSGSYVRQHRVLSYTD
jgi:hypothetical protein